MPDIEIEQLIGPGLEPTDAFVASLRREAVGVWRGDDVALSAASPRRRSRWPMLVGAAAIVAVVAVGAAASIGDRTGPSLTAVSSTLAPLSPNELMSTIVFDRPTKAWVSSNGMSALYERDSKWLLADFDQNGLVAEAPVDIVDPRSEHRVDRSSMAPADGEVSWNLLVIDGFMYELVDGEWTQGDCYLCTAYVAAPPVAANNMDGTWTVNYMSAEWLVAQPIGWDGSQPWLDTAGPNGLTVAMVAHTADTTLVWAFLRDGTVTGSEQDGLWNPVGVSPEGLLAYRDDPALLDYSVRRLPLPIQPVAPVPVEHEVGTAATPAAGGVIVGEWTGAQLRALGLEPSEVTIGVLEDGTLAGLTQHGDTILFVDASGAVIDSIPVAAQQLLVHPGDIAELIDGVTSTWVSLAAADRGAPIAAPVEPTIEVVGCVVTVNGDSWELTFPDPCDMERPLVQSDGSIVMTSSSTADGGTVSVSVQRLQVDGSIDSVELGRLAFDGSEGWLKFQASQSGGFALYHYSGDAIVLYRYDFE